MDSLAFSPDKKLIATSGSVKPREMKNVEREIKIWDIATGKNIYILQGQNSTIESLVFSKDGQFLASRSSDGSVIVWELQKRKRHLLVTNLDQNDEGVNGLVFTDDGQRLYTWDRRPEDSRYYWRCWSLQNNKEIRIPFLQPISVFVSRCTAISPNGKVVATDGKEDKRIQIDLWDLASGKKLHTLRGHSSGIASLTFSPDSKYLASAAGYDGVVILWDVASGVKRFTLDEHHGDTVHELRFSRDNRLLISKKL